MKPKIVVDPLKPIIFVDIDVLEQKNLLSSLPFSIGIEHDASVMLMITPGLPSSRICPK